MLVHALCFKQPFSLFVNDVEQFHCSELFVDVITKDVGVNHLGIYQVWDKLSEYNTCHQMLLVTTGRITKKTSKVLSILVFQVSFHGIRPTSKTEQKLYFMYLEPGVRNVFFTLELIFH